MLSMLSDFMKIVLSIKVLDQVRASFCLSCFKIKSISVSFRIVSFVAIFSKKAFEGITYGLSDRRNFPLGFNVSLKSFKNILYSAAVTIDVVSVC